MTPGIERPGGLTLWFTGLSGSGKTTLAQAVAERLALLGHFVTILDGDTLRRTLCADLGYSRIDREENVRRIAGQAAALAAGGHTVLVAAIAPYRASRLAARQQLGRYVEIYVNAPLSVCQQRDPKGLYARALAGELEHFTGIDDAYEEPCAPEVECFTDRDSVSACTDQILEALWRMCTSAVQ